MRVIVIKPYKSYNVGTDLDITNDLYAKDNEFFKPIVRMVANTSIANQAQTDEEE